VVTGLDWVKESGMLEGPIFLTNTYSVGTVYDAALTWMIDNHPKSGISEESYLPVVGECYDGILNDLQGRHVKAEHVFSALASANGGKVAEGAVGGGTGMICYQFKGGIGTSSRLLGGRLEGYTVGVLVNSNHGLRSQLRIAGIPVGKLIPDNLVEKKVDGSICIVVATDAPLNPLQLERVAKRSIMGLARTGATANNGSGDFVIAFSTTRKTYRNDAHGQVNLAEIQGDEINRLFHACVDATEEAVLNSVLMAKTTVGINGNTAYALPIGRLKTIIDRYKELLDDP
jgi:D-aminopeptidase